MRRAAIGDRHEFARGYRAALPLWIGTVPFAFVRSDRPRRRSDGARSRGDERVRLRRRGASGDRVADAGTNPGRGDRGHGAADQHAPCPLRHLADPGAAARRSPPAGAARLRIDRRIVWIDHPRGDDREGASKLSARGQPRPADDISTGDRDRGARRGRCAVPRPPRPGRDLSARLVGAVDPAGARPARPDRRWRGGRRLYGRRAVAERRTGDRHSRDRGIRRRDASSTRYRSRCSPRWSHPT